jgi:ankyrin repeat protein
MHWDGQSSRPMPWKSVDTGDNQMKSRALLAAKADVNTKDANGGTALVLASYQGHLEVVQTLVAAKADVNAKGINGGTALMAASLPGHLEIVRALLAAKADVNAKAANGGAAVR